MSAVGRLQAFQVAPILEPVPLNHGLQGDAPQAALA
jgi:hypothetical protein